MGKSEDRTVLIIVCALMAVVVSYLVGLNHGREEASINWRRALWAADLPEGCEHHLREGFEAMNAESEDRAMTAEERGRF